MFGYGERKLKGVWLRGKEAKECLAKTEQAETQLTEGIAKKEIGFKGMKVKEGTPRCY